MTPTPGPCHCSPHICTQDVVIRARTLRRRIHDARFRWKRPAMSTANGRRMSVPKRGHGPTAETRVPGGRRAVVHRLDAAAAVSTAPGDVGRDRHAGHGGHPRPKRQTCVVWHDQCANRAPDSHHRPQRSTTVEFLPFGPDWIRVAEIRFSENKDLPTTTTYLGGEK